MTILNRLRQQRGEAVVAARKINDLATTEKRSITPEERGQFDALMKKVTDLGDEITREERLQEMERETASKASGDPEKRAGQENNAGGGSDQAEVRAAAFSKALGQGFNALNAEETRALNFGTDADGGYLSATEEFMAMLIKDVDNAVYIRSLATVMPLNGPHSLGIPTLDTDVSDAAWTTELATGDEDGDMAFGKRVLKPLPLAKRIKISNKLLHNSMLPAEAIVRERLAYKFAVAQENGFMNGSGAGQALGVFTASANGISSGRDISTGNTATEIRGDGLLEAKYSLKSQYLSKAQWMFHRDGVKQVAKLKDGDGQYIWQPGLQAGQPDRLLNIPLSMSEYAPNTFTTGLYAGILGDFSKYWIVDNLSMQLQRLTELYAETNQVGFIGRAEVDGAPVLEEAFARVTLG